MQFSRCTSVYSFNYISSIENAIRNMQKFANMDWIQFWSSLASNDYVLFSSVWVTRAENIPGHIICIDS